MPPISVLIKPASGMCNMRCDYCFYCDETEKRTTKSYGLMSADTLRNVIRRTLLRAQGHYSIAFQGGEPTLCGIAFFEKAMEYIAQYNKNHVPVHLAIQTNGYNMNEEWASFFARHHFLVGISVDGTKELHDTYRHGADGGPTYERVLEATRILDRHHVDYNILTVVHQKTAANIEEIYRNYARNNWKFLQFIACLDPLGEAKGTKEYSLTPEMYGQFMTELFHLWMQDFQKGEHPFIRQFENYIGILLNIPPEACEHRGVCGIQYVVEADGSVYPCDFYAVDEYKLGNLNADQLDVIDAARNSSGFLTRSSVIPDTCKTCKWFALCRNACYRNRIADTNYFCEGYQYFFEHCYEDMLKIADAVRRTK